MVVQNRSTLCFYLPSTYSGDGKDVDTAIVQRKSVDSTFLRGDQGPETRMVGYRSTSVNFTMTRLNKIRLTKSWSRHEGCARDRGAASTRTWVQHWRPNSLFASPMLTPKRPFSISPIVKDRRFRATNGKEPVLCVSLYITHPLLYRRHHAVLL